MDRLFGARRVAELRQIGGAERHGPLRRGIRARPRNPGMLAPFRPYAGGVADRQVSTRRAHSGGAVDQLVWFVTWPNLVILSSGTLGVEA
jgi:hypothetical protein